jgi:hypothetical protein
MGKWMRPRPVAPTNIFEGLVTHNITEPTYTVDEVGWSIALHAPARSRSAIPIGMGRPETPIASPPPPRGMRQWNGDGTYSMVMTVPKGNRSG